MQSSIISEAFFIIDKDNLNSVCTKLYGFCIANDESSLFNESEKTDVILQNLDSENYTDGAYVLIQNFKNEIKISQDFNGCFGLYLYETANYFALSNSFVLLVEHLRKKFPLTLDFDYINTYFLSGLTATSYSETMIKEIQYLPKDVKIVINKASKTVDLQKIDYKNNTVSIDSQNAMEILDKWYNKWINIIRYIKMKTNKISVDLSGGMDSRLVFLLFLKSGIDLNMVRVNSYKDTLHTHKEDYEIATAIANRFGFELNINHSEDNKSIPLTLSDSINLMSYSRLCFCTEIYHKLSFSEKKAYSFTGSGGEAIRKHWAVKPEKFIKDIEARGNRYNNTDFANSVNKILNHAFAIVKIKYHIDDENDSAIMDGFYRETRLRNHFGRELALNSICNVFRMAPLLDSALTQLCLKECQTIDRDIIIAVIIDRYCPELLNFKFDSNRSIDSSVIKYAHEINSKYPLIKEQPFIEGKWILDSDLEYQNKDPFPVTLLQAKAVLLRSFLSETTYKSFTKYFNKEIYDDAYSYSQKVLFHPEAKYVPILGIIKIIHDIKGNIVYSTPYDLFKGLSTDCTIARNNLIDNTFATARIDIKNFSEENNDNDVIIELRNNQYCKLEQPKWFHKNGIGYLLTSNHGEGIDAEITCLNEGLLKLNLRSLDVRKKDNQRIEILIDYKKLVINTLVIFDSILPCSHDHCFQYSLPVKSGQKISVHLEWDKHNYESLLEYYKVFSMIAESFLGS